MVVPWRGGAVVCMLILYGVRDTGVEIIQKYANNSHNNIGYRNSGTHCQHTIYGLFLRHLKWKIEKNVIPRQVPINF